MRDGNWDDASMPRSGGIPRQAGLPWLTGLRGVPGFGLRLRIAALLALIVVGLTVTFGLVIGEASVNQARDRQGETVASDAERLAERLDTEMAARAREVELLGAVGPVKALASGGASTEAARSALDWMQHSFPAYSWIGVTDARGHVLAGTGGMLEGQDISSRDSFQEVLTARQDGGADSTQQARSFLPDDSRRVMDIVHPVTDAQGRLVAVVFAQLDWRWLENLSAAVLDPQPQPGDARQTFLVASDDTVIMGPGDTIGQKLMLADVARARAGYAGWEVTTWPDGGQYLTGSAFAAGIGAYPGPGSQKMQWAVLVRNPVAVGFGPATQLRNLVMLAGAGVAIVFALVGWFLAGRIASPLVRMATAAERIRQGDDVELPMLGGATEFESLSASLRALVASLTHKQLALAELQALTMHDPLTGVLNRSGLRDYFGRAMPLARQTDLSLLVLVGDLDGFKAVNDERGHAAGDAVLCEVANRLQACVRSRDAVARFGGDEFVVVLEAAGGNDVAAMQLAKRLMEAVASPCWIAREPVRVGCSIGGAVWPADGESIDQVIAKADAALYAVKREGKNFLLMHGERFGRPSA